MFKYLCPLLLLFSSFTYGQEIKIYPEKISPGDYIVASIDTESIVYWVIYDEKERFDIFENGHVLVLGAGLKPRTINGLVLIINADASFKVIRFNIDVGNPPDPPDPPDPPNPPDPPDPPDPPNPDIFNLREIAKASVSKVPEEYRNLAPKMAEAIKTGLDPRIIEPQDLIFSVKSNLKEALGENYEDWLPWGREIAVVMEEHESELKNIQTLRSAYLAIAQGLLDYSNNFM